MARFVLVLGAMRVQINTDSHIEGTEELAAHVEGVVRFVLGRFSDRITRVEVHLSNQNNESEMRCMMEARLEGRQPTAVTHHAETLEDAVDGAADKLKRSVESTLERLAVVLPT